MIKSGFRDLLDERDDIREYLYETITIYIWCYINAWPLIRIGGTIHESPYVPSTFRGLVR